MKKLFIFCLSVLFLINFGFSENIFSLSVSPDFEYMSFNNDDYSFVMSNYKVKFGFDYKHITNNGFMFGAQVTFQPDIYLLGSKDNSLNGITIFYTGPGFSFAPILGYRFGNKNLMGIEVLPIVISHSSLNGEATLQKQIGNTVGEQKHSQNGSKMVVCSEIRANILFGNNLVRNGFIVGVGIPWYIDLSKAEIDNSKTK